MVVQPTRPKDLHRVPGQQESVEAYDDQHEPDARVVNEPNEDEWAGDAQLDRVGHCLTDRARGMCDGHEEIAEVVLMLMIVMWEDLAIEMAVVLLDQVSHHEVLLFGVAERVKECAHSMPTIVEVVVHVEANHVPANVRAGRYEDHDFVTITV